MNYYLIIFMLSFVLITIIISHFYFKNEIKHLYTNLAGEDYLDFKSIKTEIISSSKLSYKLQYFISDIILCNNKIVLISKSSILNPFTKLQLGIIQLSHRVTYKTGDKCNYVIEEITYSKNKVKILTQAERLIKTKIEILLNFYNRLDELNQFQNFNLSINSTL